MFCNEYISLLLAGTLYHILQHCILLISFMKSLTGDVHTSVQYVVF